MGACRRVPWRQVWAIGRVMAALGLGAGWQGCSSEAPAKLVCSDPNPCVAAFEFKGKCAHVPLSGPACVIPATAMAGICEAGGCAGPACHNVTCDDGNSCTVDTCDPATGKCVAEAAPDGQACTKTVAGCMVQEGKCAGSVCDDSGVQVTSCDDGNPCTDDSCSSESLCVHIPVAAGTSCADPLVSQSQCLVANCDSAGVCETSSLAGQACSLSAADAGPCVSGICGETGACQKVALSGQSCTPPGANLGPCQGGVCDATGTCTVKGLVGKLCEVTAGSGATCAQGACDASLVCQPKTPSAVAPCDADTGCAPKFCTSNGICKLNTPPNSQPCFSPWYTKLPYVGVCSGGQCNPVTYCDSAKKDLFENPCISVSLDPASACTTTVKTGAPCTVPPAARLPCFSDAGVCDAVGLCVPVSPDVGAPCTIDECRAGVCAADGSCALVPKTGSPCYKYWDLGPCSTQQCGADGECHIVAKDPSLPCKLASPCRQKAGHCDGVGTGSCTSELLPAGTDCSGDLSVFDRSNTCTQKASCAADGSCVVQITPGTACSSECTFWGTCAADGACVGKSSWGPGTPCLTPCGGVGKCQAGDGRCHGTPGVSCSVAGDTCADCVCNSDGLPEVKSSKPDGTPCSTSCMDYARCVHGACMGAPSPGSCYSGPCKKDVCCAEILLQPKVDAGYSGSPLYKFLPTGCFSSPGAGAPSNGCGSVALETSMSCSGYSCMGYSAYCNDGDCLWEKAAAPYCWDTSPDSGDKETQKLMCEADARCAAPYTYDLQFHQCNVAKFGTWDKATAKPTYKDTSSPVKGCIGADVTCLHGQCVLAKP